MRQAVVGFLLHEPGKFETFSEFFRSLFRPLTAMIGFWATLLPQHAGLHAIRQKPTRTGSRSGRCVADNDGRLCRDGHPDHIGRRCCFSANESADCVGSCECWSHNFSQPVVIAISMFTIVVATLSVNIAANVVSPAQRFRKRFSKMDLVSNGRFDHRHHRNSDDAVEAARDPSGYIFSWLLGYSGGLGSIAGVLDR
jgi:NCS1 family nucleobase:cation symporter-1